MHKSEYIFIQAQQLLVEEFYYYLSSGEMVKYSIQALGFTKCKLTPNILKPIYCCKNSD